VCKTAAIAKAAYTVFREALAETRFEAGGVELCCICAACKHSKPVYTQFVLAMRELAPVASVAVREVPAHGCFEERKKRWIKNEDRLIQLAQLVIPVRKVAPIAVLAGGIGGAHGCFEKWVRRY